MSPTREEVRAARAASGLTQAQAARLVWCSTRAWEQWEGGQRPMPGACWELFRIKVAPSPKAAP